MKQSLVPGKLVYWNNEPVVILELRSLNELVIRPNDGGRTEIVRVSDISTGPVPENNRKGHYLIADDKEWEKATRRFEIIRPLLESGGDASHVQEVAEKAGKGQATIYRWLKKYKETGRVSSLMKPPRSDKGATQLSDEVEEIIQQEIAAYYLKKERRSVALLHRRIKAICLDSDLIPPHLNTIHNRVQNLDERDKVKSRLGRKIAKQLYQPTTGQFPGAFFPNDVHQIDHTPVDLIIVDEIHRQPIGKPYLTISIDTATKALAGFCVSLESPSSLTAGLCISHAVLQKENWLAKRDINEEWPVYGKMQKIHVDNAPEFRGKMLRRACKENGIILEWRPKGCPNYGPHVERAFRTFMQECHAIPGTTFSNVKQRLDYDSEGHACMTLSEFEVWFTVFVTHVYHHQPHKGNGGVSPIKLYHKMLLDGVDGRPPAGLPCPIQDMEKFRLDFTPYVERTIQRSGVVIDNVRYFGQSLRKWINAKEPGAKQVARKFIFARDPRNISVIYFLNPDTEEYEEIPYLDTSLPAISLWELQSATQKLKDDPLYTVDEHTIFKGVKKLRELEEASIEKTRLARQQRATEKRKRRNAERRKQNTLARAELIKPEAPMTVDDEEDIQPFDDMEIG